MKILEIERIKLKEPVLVYDLTVEGTENFQLKCGSFVHNSKDCADGCAGVAYMLQLKEANYGRSSRRRVRRSSASGTDEVRHVRVGRRRRMHVV